MTEKEKNLYICSPLEIAQAEIAQLVEHQLPKLRVASSNLVFRSRGPLQSRTAAVFHFNPVTVLFQNGV